MEAKFTKGTWRLGCRMFDRVPVVSDSEKCKVAEVIYDMEEHVYAANAHLIASCPAMYEAISAIIPLLLAPRNRFGKIELVDSQREPVRLLAVKYGVPLAEDSAEQAGFVLRAVLAKAEGRE